MPSSVSSTATAKRRGQSTTRKHHICSVCERGFSTTGHLARHTRVHTGERNHKCPFPGCETKCSRQDNLQQHYRIHLSPGSRRKSGRSVLRSKSTPAPSPPAASPSASDEMYHREDSPPIEPPALEDSRLYYFARGGVVESPPNSPPPLVEAYSAAAPTHHRELPQINTAVSVSAPSSPEMYWQSQQSQQSGDVSPLSDAYGSAVSVSAYQSPVVPQSQYAQSAATSPALSPVASYAPSTSTSYSSLASAEGYPAYEQQRMIHAPQPHITVSASGPYTHPLHRNSSHSPAAVPVSRSLATRHSIANIAAHAHVQQQQQQAYATTEPALDPDSPSPPPSSHQSPQTPFHEHVPAYATGHYAAQPGMGNVGMVTSGAYAAYDAHGNLLAPAHAQGQVQYTPLEMAPVPAMQYHPCAPAPHEVHGHMQKPWSPQPMLTDFPSLRRASHGHPHVHGHGGGGGESYPAARRDSYPQYVHAQTPQQEGYLAYAAPAPANVEVEVEERERDAPQPYIYQPQPQPRFHPQYFAGYGWHSTTGEPALVQ